MPARFKEVVPGLLYRGGEPQLWEIKALKEQFGIEQIISLDKKIGNKIDNYCKICDIKHIIIPINSTNEDDKDLQIIENGVTSIVDRPTYVHCLHGKDRTGLFVAKYRTENGWTCKEAIDEAIPFGFGIGLNNSVINRYVNIINSSCKENHKHVDLTYVIIKITKKSTCHNCGMIKYDNICNECFVLKGLIKNASLLESDIDKNIVDQVQEDLSIVQLKDEENDIGGGGVVSDLFNVPERVALKMRIKILKQAASQLSFEIPEHEKQTAVKCIELLKNFDDNLFKVKGKDGYVEILDVLYNPFNESEGSITTEQANSAAKFFNIFIESLKFTLMNNKKTALQCIKLLEKFNSDSEVGSMIKAFFESIDKLSSQVDMLEEILSDVDDKNMQENAVNAMNNIKKISAQLKHLINERIISYLRKDILNEDWTTEIEKDIQRDVKDIKGLKT